MKGLHRVVKRLHFKVAKSIWLDLGPHICCNLLLLGKGLSWVP